MSEDLSVAIYIAIIMNNRKNNDILNIFHPLTSNVVDTYLDLAHCGFVFEKEERIGLKVL